MPSPIVTDVELSTGEGVPLSFDIETGIPIEITLYGSNLNELEDITLDSGEDVSWMITGTSASNNTAVVTAYASGSAGSGYILVRNNTILLFQREVPEFYFPLLD